MKLNDYVKEYIESRVGAAVPPAWQAEVMRIACGRTSVESAKERGVTRDAVKAQRTKIFKAFKVENAQDLLVDMFHNALKRV